MNPDRDQARARAAATCGVLAAAACDPSERPIVSLLVGVATVALVTDVLGPPVFLPALLRWCSRCRP